jgi:tol-pal system protein YbgF
MMMNGTRVIAATAALALLPVAAAAQNREHQQIFGDLRMLQEQIAKLQLTANVLGEQVQAVNKRIDAQAADSVKAFAEQRLIITTLASTVSTVREKLEDNTVRVSQVTTEMGAIREGLRLLTDQLNQLLGLLQPANMPGATPPDPAAGAAAGAPPPGAGGQPIGSVRLPASPLTVFKDSLADYMGARYELAISGFKDFLDKFPQTPDAPRAQLYIGDSYSALKRYKEALAAYAEVVAKYKDSEAAREALFSQGNTYLLMNMRPEAEKTFRQIIGQYPTSDQAVFARQRLASMGIKGE